MTTDAPNSEGMSGAGGSDRSTLRIHLLGAFRITAGGVELPPDALSLRNASRLVKRLAMAPDRTMLREQLLDLLWPDADFTAAGNSLRQTLHVARRELRTLPLDPALILQSRGDRVSLYPPDLTWTDVRAFEDAARVAQDRNDPALYWDAIECYTGAFLPEDLYEEWTISYRDELAATYHALLDDVAGLHEARNEAARAIAALRRLVGNEPIHEAAHARLMRLYAVTGKRPQAMRQYHVLVDTLSEMLDVEPESATTELYREIKEGLFPGVVPPRDATLPGRSSTVHTTNLPHALTSFVGREPDIESLETALRDNRLVTLTGVGGIGKTRLALEVARSLVALFAGGVWLVELASLNDARLIPGTIAASLHVREDAQASIEDVIIDHLRDRRVLLVLDNTEHLLPGCAEIVRRLLEACPDLHLLVTGRSRLDIPGEVVWRVSPLAVPSEGEWRALAQLALLPSTRLFVERARLIQPEFALTAENAKDVATICRRVDGLPLAIELAAAWTNVLSVSEIAERLADSLSLLVGKNHHPERHRALRATLEWSARLLTPAERRLFRRMSVFTSDCSIEAAEAVCSGEDGPDGVLESLSMLVDKSLVIADVLGVNSRYRMLEPVRQYASELLDTSGERALAHDRHAAYFLSLAETAEIYLTGPQQRAWLERLESEDEHLQAAVDWLARSVDTSTSLRLAAALWRYWYQRGRVHQGIANLVGRLETSREIDPSIQAKALLGAGAFLFRTGDLVKARMFLEQSICLCRALGDSGGLGWATAFLGHVVGAQHEDDLALACAEDSLILFRQTNDLSGMARALNALGEVARAAGDDDTAANRYEEALSLDRALGDQAGIALRLHNLGYVDLHRCKFDQAVVRFAECLELQEESGDVFLAAIAAQGLAVTSAAAGRHRTAALLFGAAAELRQMAGGTIDVAELRDHERFSATARTGLGEAAFDELWERGRLLAPADVVAWARSDLPKADQALPDFRSRDTTAATRCTEPGHQTEVTLNELTRPQRSSSHD